LQRVKIERALLRVSHMLRIRETRSQHAHSLPKSDDILEPAVWRRA
jgi:hypothetical protein